MAKMRNWTDLANAKKQERAAGHDASKAGATAAEIEKSIEAEHKALKALMLKALPDAQIETIAAKSIYSGQTQGIDSSLDFNEFLKKRKTLVFEVPSHKLSAPDILKLRPFQKEYDGVSFARKFKVNFGGDGANYQAFVEVLIGIIKEQISETAKGTISTAAQKAYASLAELEKHVQRIDLPLNSATARAMRSVETALEKAIIEPGVRAK